MPLFGSKHHNDNTTSTNKLSKGDHHQAQPTTYQGGLTGASGANPAHSHQTQPGSHGVGGATGYGNNTGLNQPGNTYAPNQTSAYNNNQPMDNAFPTGNAMPVGGIGHNAAIPPASAVSHGPGGGNTGGGHSMSGKIESALGSLVGSAALKEKGAQKEQEANNIKLQGRELAEAERLEAEALMRRERAVAHGAHPANAPLGGPNLGN